MKRYFLKNYKNMSILRKRMINLNKKVFITEQIR